MPAPLPSPALPLVSTTSANALLSDLRPTTLAPAALGHINALLDELLVSIITASRSLNLTDLRTRGVAAVLTTEGHGADHLSALGRAAVGEAEVEIRSWYEGHPTARKGVSGFPPGGRGRGLVAELEAYEALFPVQQAVQLMRIKVAQLATHAPDLPQVMKGGGTRAVVDAWKAAGGDTSDETLSPAALWLTAVLEHVCEHILQKLSQVVARDSSVVAATIQDLYTALCEDANVYGFFKRTEAKRALEGDVRAAAARPKHRIQMRRTTSSAGNSRASPTESPHSSHTSLPRTREDPPQHSLHSRQSSTGSGRPASEQFYKSVIGVAKSVPSVTHKRSSSYFSGSTKVGEDEQSKQAASITDSVEDEFDALLRSNETVRVSLTPSRLSTFEDSSTKPSRRHSHLLAPPSSSETSLASTSTQANSDRMAVRAAAGRSWSGTSKLTPRGGTFDEREEDDLGQSIIELLKAEPRQAQQSGPRTVPAVIVATPLPPAPPGLDDDKHGSAQNDSTRDKPRPTRSVSESATDPAAINGRMSLRGNRHLSEQVESRQESRELANFLSTSPPTSNSHHPEESSGSAGPHHRNSIMPSFRGLMSRIRKPKEEDRKLIPTGSTSTLRSSAGSQDHSNGASQRSLRSPTSTPSVHSGRSARSGSTLHPQDNFYDALSNTSDAQSERTHSERDVPTARQVLRKPSLVRKWAQSVNSSGERARRPSRSTAPSPNTVSLDDDLDPMGHVGLGLGLEQLDDQPGTPEAALAALNGSRGGSSPAYLPDIPESASGRSAQRILRHERIDALSADASSRAGSPSQSIPTPPSPAQKRTDPFGVPSQGFIPLADLVPLRGLLENATSARECQLLLDAILTQLGVPRNVEEGEEWTAGWLLGGRETPLGKERTYERRERERREQEKENEHRRERSEGAVRSERGEKERERERAKTPLSDKENFDDTRPRARGMKGKLQRRTSRLSPEAMMKNLPEPPVEEQEQERVAV